VSAIHNPFRFNGEYTDFETGFQYLRMRFYDPNLGRFINEDPIRHGFNWYKFAAINPIMFVDPTGMREEPTGYERSQQHRWERGFAQRLNASAGASGNLQFQALPGPTTNEAALMADHIYNFSSIYDFNNANFAGRSIGLGNRIWLLIDIWITGTVIMGIYELAASGNRPRELAGVFQGTTASEDWVDNIAASVASWAANLETARGFARGLRHHNPFTHLTFIGHSKGGGEAIVAGLAVQQNVITFNSANFMWGSDARHASGIRIRNYYVQGEILTHLRGVPSVGTPIRLDPVYYSVGLFGIKEQSIADRVNNHSISAVLRALRNR